MLSLKSSVEKFYELIDFQGLNQVMITLQCLNPIKCLIQGTGTGSSFFIRTAPAVQGAQIFFSFF